MNCFSRKKKEQVFFSSKNEKKALKNNDQLE